LKGSKKQNWFHPYGMSIVDFIRKVTSPLASEPPSAKAEQEKQSSALHFLTQRFDQFLKGSVAPRVEAYNQILALIYFAH
jgi:hypothetical protein